MTPVRSYFVALRQRHYTTSLHSLLTMAHPRSRRKSFATTKICINLTKITPDGRSPIRECDQDLSQRGCRGQGFYTGGPNGRNRNPRRTIRLRQNYYFATHRRVRGPDQWYDSATRESCQSNSSAGSQC